MRLPFRFPPAPAAAGVPDAELLRRFAATADEAAFELLVRRHAAVVWAACRRVLRNDSHAAEDAFQAAFLALAKSPAAVRSGSAAGWLYRVAVHAALKARRAGGTGRPGAGGPRSAPAASPADPADATAAAELTALVHEELARLPDKYRQPVVLCDLGGLSREEAAARLDWPPGTVAGRLARAREQLRRRLERRGVTLPTAATAAALAANEGTASPDLVRAAVAVVGGAVPPNVLFLTRGVLSAMRIAKLKLLAAAAGVAIGLAGTGVVVAVSQEKKPAPEAPTTDVGKPPKAEIKEPFTTAFPNIAQMNWDGEQCPRFTGKTRPAREASDVVLRLAQERLDALVKASNLYVHAMRNGSMNLDNLYLLQKIYREIPSAAAEVFGTGTELVRWYEEWVAATKWVEEIVMARFEAGNARQLDLEQMRAERFYAERELLKLMARVKAGNAR